MLPKNRPPTHPGEMLLKEFLEPMNVSQKDFCQHLGWTYARLNEIIHGKRGITASSALALGEALKMEPNFWLNLQTNWDLWHASIKKPFHTLTKKVSLKARKAATKLAAKILGTQKATSGSNNLTIEVAIGQNDPKLYLSTYSETAYPWKFSSL